jgi:hypothetical protein
MLVTNNKLWEELATALSFRRFSSHGDEGSKKHRWVIMQFIYLFHTGCNWKLQPVTVAARSRAWNAFASLNTGIVGSNLAIGMDVCVYSVFVLSCVGSGLATGWLFVQGVLPIVCKCKITEPHKRRPRPDMGCSAIQEEEELKVADKLWARVPRTKTRKTIHIMCPRTFHLWVIVERILSWPI